jgi:hypothetical protein
MLIVMPCMLAQNQQQQQQQQRQQVDGVQPRGR